VIDSGSDMANHCAMPVWDEGVFEIHGAGVQLFGCCRFHEFGGQNSASSSLIGAFRGRTWPQSDISDHVLVVIYMNQAELTPALHRILYMDE